MQHTCIHAKHIHAAQHSHTQRAAHPGSGCESGSVILAPSKSLLDAGVLGSFQLQPPSASLRMTFRRGIRVVRGGATWG
jgi:hypothetical protein